MRYPTRTAVRALIVVALCAAAPAALAAQPFGDTSYHGSGKGWHGYLHTSTSGRYIVGGRFAGTIPCTTGTGTFEYAPAKSLTGARRPIHVTSSGTFRRHTALANNHHGFSTSSSISGRFVSRTRAKGTAFVHFVQLSSGVSCSRTFHFTLNRVGS